jgi:hypothetical protein
MGIERSEVEGLLGPLYAAVGTQEGWTTFLERLCTATGSHAGTVAVFDAGGGGNLPAYVGAGQDVARLYEGRYASENPWRTSTASPGQVRVSDDLMPWHSLRTTDFYRHFLRPIDVAHGVGLVGAITGGRTPSLTVLRSSGAGVFAGTELNLLERLAPHWLNASALWARLDAVERPALDLRAALDRLSVGVLLLDGEGRLIQANAAGTEALSNGLLRVRNGRLTAQEPSDRPSLAAVLLRASRSPGTPQAAMVLRDAHGRPAATVGVHRLSGPGSEAGVRLLMFVQPLWAVRPGLAGRLQETLGLTPAEARLAEALWRCRGNLGAAAGMLGLSPGAARTRIKTVLGKAGVVSQTELMGLMGGW